MHKPDRPTLAQDPQRWKGASEMWREADGSVWLLGLRDRVSRWEQLTPPESTRHADGPVKGAQLYVAGSPDIARTASWRLREVILDDEAFETQAVAVLASMYPDHAAILKQLPSPGDRSGTEQRRMVDVRGLDVIDFRFSTLPNSQSTSTQALQYGSRWLRIVSSQETLTLLWYPVAGLWSPTEIRWPHSGVPSLPGRTLEALSQAQSAGDALGILLLACVTHETYFLTSWLSELDRVETRLFASMSHLSGSAETTVDEASNAVAILSEYLSQVQADTRRLERRLEVEPLLEGVTHDHLADQVEALSKQLQECTMIRRDALAVLAQVTSAEQLRTSQIQARQSERLQRMVLFVTTVILAPGLVISIYGSNIRQLDPSSLGNLVDLLIWSLFATTVALAIWWTYSKPTRLGVIFTLFVIPLGSVPSLLNWQPPWTSVAWLMLTGATVLAWISGWLAFRRAKGTIGR